MITRIDKEKLNDLIKSFYNITGIKVAVYDGEFSEIIAYPEENSAFCKILHNNPASLGKCEECTKKLCMKCQRQNKVINEVCHAGLNEVIAPLSDGVSVIGYIMFGQITNEENKDVFFKRVTETCKDYNIDSSLLNNTLSYIPYYSKEQTGDVSKILVALSKYIVFDKIAYSEETPVAYKIAGYIRSNLSKSLTIKDLCREFYLSKSEIYKITRQYMPDGIASFIKKERIEKASEMLRFTNKTSMEIAEGVGFSNVDYFLRCFKADKGMSASKYKSIHKKC